MNPCEQPVAPATSARERERESERESGRALERLDTISTGARDGLWDLDAATNTLHVSPRWKELIGYAADELGDRPEEWFQRVHPREVESLRRAIDALLDGRMGLLETEFRMRHKDGSWRWILCRAARHAERPLLGGSLTDVTALKQAENEILVEAFHDPLTGLPNKRLFLDRLGLALGRRRLRASQPVAVLYLDLDRFHNVNDSLGVDAGDELLVEVTDRLTRLLRLGDTLGRMGGDEFAILLDGIAGPREALCFGQEVSGALERPLRLRGQEVFASCSMGISLSNGNRSVRPEDLLSDATSAMHLAKLDERRSCQLFDPETGAQAKERLRLEADLRRALERNEFVLHYQPIVSFADGGLTAFEALVRWQHPERGLVRPEVFVPLAEETGLVVGLGSWVLQEACRQLREWHDLYPAGRRTSVAVNLSARQFEHEGLVGEVAGRLHESGLDPSSLHLEMTESVVMARTRENRGRLRSLRDLGVKLLIDDFGTGYSSLAHLQSFALDALKIDRSFVMGMEFEDGKAEIVRTVLALARALDMEVVAEGIETVGALEMLRNLDCQHGQGYFFSIPMDGESAAAWIQDPPRY